jgi:DNA polymerase-3 subunit alpha (Gram-positive type)
MLNKDEIITDDLDLVFFDTELTGLEMHHEIIEIGFIKVRAKTFEVIIEKQIKIKPVHLETANRDSLEIAGYKEADWADAVDIKTALQEFLSYTENAMLVGHNLPMDWLFLKKSLAECQLPSNFYYKGLDTFSLAWQKLRETGMFHRYSLKELSAHFNVSQGNAHRALDDARTTYEIFKKLVVL